MIKPSTFKLEEIDQALIEAFGDDVYAIGGRVRDWLIAEQIGTLAPAKDFDYVVTGHDLHGVEDRLRFFGARVDAVGASFAVLKVTLCGQTIDIALPRRESSTGNGHRDFTVDFGPEVNLEDDQMRRDFTINAVSVQLRSRKLIAVPSALDDIEAKTIRVLSPESFTDDPLRILRAVQFASRLGFTIEPQTEVQIRTHSNLLATVSPERINEELCKLLLKSRQPSIGIRLLVDLGLMPYVVPEYLESIGCAQNKHHAYDVAGHLCATLDAAAEDDGDLIDRLAALLHDIGKPRTAARRADGAGQTFYGHEDVGAEMVPIVLRRLRFSEDQIGAVRSLVANHMFASCNADGTPFSSAAVRRLMRRIGSDLIDRQFALREADMRGSSAPRDVRRAHVQRLRRQMDEIAANAPALTVSALAIDGHDIIDHLVSAGHAPLGFRGDQRVGKVLGFLLESVLDDPGRNTREGLRDLLKSVVLDKTLTAR